MMCGLWQLRSANTELGASDGVVIWWIRLPSRKHPTATGDVCAWCSSASKMLVIS